MCMTLAPARLSNTTLYVAEVSLKEGVIHVVGYQNMVQNLATSPSVEGVEGEDWGWGDKSAPVSGMGNAMILPFPAVPGTMTQANVVETRSCPRILTDIAKALQPPATFGGRDMLSSGSKGMRVEVFNTGIYTVVLASSPRLIPKVMDRVPEEKRPSIRDWVFNEFAKWYPEWTVALCCFNNRDAKLSTPLLWWYEPMFPDRLFAPALDCHTGEAPDLNKRVQVDHTVAVSSYRMWPQGKSVFYSDKTIPDKVHKFLPSYVIGDEFKYDMKNGDFVCRTEDVQKGIFAPKRLKPPGA